MAKFGPWKQSLNGAVIVVSSDKKRFPAGKVVDDLVEYVDLAPTILAAAGLDVDSNNIYSDNFALGNGAMDISELDYDFRPGGIGFEYIPVFSANEFLEMVKAQSLYSEPDVKKDGITEETTAAYLSFDFVTDFNNMPFNASFGVRYEETDVESYSVQRPVTGFNWITPIQLSKVLADEERTEILEGAYEHFLPNEHYWWSDNAVFVQQNHRQKQHWCHVPGHQLRFTSRGRPL